MFSLFICCCALMWVLCCCLEFSFGFQENRCSGCSSLPSKLFSCVLVCVGGLLVFASICSALEMKPRGRLFCAAWCALTVKHTHVAFEWEHQRQSSLVIALRWWQEATQFRQWQYVQSAFFKDLRASTRLRHEYCVLSSSYRPLSAQMAPTLLLTWDWK
jgi:hypothetical protein